MEAVSVAKMRALEKKAIASGITELELMERAGRECAKLIRGKFDGRSLMILLFCGPGNNGGDGLVCARYLNEDNDVRIVMPLEPRTESAKTNHRRAKSAGVEFISLDDAAAMSPDIVVDALLGIGARPGLEGQIRDACRIINSSEAFKISIDIPTGMDADTGGCDPDAVVPDATICIHAPKKGVAGAGFQKTGELWVADIGLGRPFSRNGST